MASETGQKIVVIHILPNISKTGAKTCANVVPGPFLKDRSWALLCINSPKFNTVCFYCMSRLMAIKRY